MGRSGYNYDHEDNWRAICWRGAVTSAIRGKRGQAFLKEMLAALDALPKHELIAEELEREGAVCALGAVGKARQMDMSQLDPWDHDTVAHVFGIPNSLAREIFWENDEAAFRETPEQRFQRVRGWVCRQISGGTG